MRPRRPTMASTSMYFAARKIPKDQKQQDEQTEAAMRAVPVNICIPQRATSGQLADVLINYLRGHPETRHKEIGTLAMYAFKKAFPC